MFRLICDYCGEEITFEKIDQKPEICAICNSSLEDIKVEKLERSEDNEAQTQEKGNLAGLVLIYQETGEEIDIEHSDKIILGRQNIGREVLGKITNENGGPVISGSHCSIEFDTEQNQYFLNDLNSRNGTFFGVTKINCKTNPNQKLSDSDLIYLGREPFLVKLKYKSIDSEERQAAEKPKIDVKTPQGYECQSCYDYWSEESSFTCPKCGSWNDFS